MSQRQLQVLAGLLVAATVLYLLPRLFDRPEGSGSVGSGAGFRLEYTGQPVRIDIIDPAGSSIRIEQESDGWTVDGHPTDSTRIQPLLEALDEGLEAREIAARNPDNHAALGVEQSTGRRVELYTDAGGPVVFYLGDRATASGGHFIRAPDSDEVYRADSRLLSYLAQRRDDWRDRQIGAVDTARVREIYIERGGESRTLIRDETGGWTVGSAAADSGAVQSLLELLASLRASGFPTDDAARAADFGEPDAVVDVFAESSGDVTGRELVMSLRMLEPEDGGNWLVRRADETEVYLLSSIAASRLAPEAERLLAEGGG